MDKVIIAKERGYTINKEGKVFNKNGKQTGFGKTDKGYPTLSFNIGGKKVSILCHRLQAYMKYGDELFKEGIVARHLNSIKTDCSWDNITIGTQKQNSLDNPPEQRLKYALNATRFVRKFDKQIIKDFYKQNGWGRTMEHFSIKSKGTLSYLLNK